MSHKVNIKKIYRKDSARLQKRQKLCEVVGDKTVIRTLSYPDSHALMFKTVPLYKIRIHKVSTNLIKREANDSGLNLRTFMNRVKDYRGMLLEN